MGVSTRNSTEDPSSAFFPFRGKKVREPIQYSSNSASQTTVSTRLNYLSRARLSTLFLRTTVLVQKNVSHLIAPTGGGKPFFHFFSLFLQGRNCLILLAFPEVLTLRTEKYARSSVSRGRGSLPPECGVYAASACELNGDFR